MEVAASVGSRARGREKMEVAAPIGFRAGAGGDGGRRRDLEQDSASPFLDGDDGEARRGVEEALGGRCDGWVNG
jgi:hypothetical protein